MVSNCDPTVNLWTRFFDRYSPWHFKKSSDSDASRSWHVAFKCKSVSALSIEFEFRYSDVFIRYWAPVKSVSLIKSWINGCRRFCKRNGFIYCAPFHMLTSRELTKSTTCTANDHKCQYTAYKELSHRTSQCYMYYCQVHGTSQPQLLVIIRIRHIICSTGAETLISWMHERANQTSHTKWLRRGAIYVRND